MIKTFLFDLGNVLLFFSHERMYRQIGLVMGMAPHRVRSILAKNELQWRYEAGDVTTNELFEVLAAEGSAGCSRLQFVEAASDIFTPNQAMLPVLKALRERNYRLVIVSNTNEAHIEYASRRFGCFGFFDAAVYSFQIKAMKPAARFYEAAARLAGCAPQSCLFTDDRLENVQGALEFGFQAVSFTDTDSFVGELKRRRLL